MYNSYSDVTDLPPEAMYESPSGDSNDFDSGFDENGVPINDDQFEESYEEQIIADSANSVDYSSVVEPVKPAPVVDTSLTGMVLSTIVPQGGQIYGFKRISGLTFEVSRSIPGTDKWELRPDKITLTGNTSLEIAFMREMKRKSGDRWTVAAAIECEDKIHTVMGILPKGV